MIKINKSETADTRSCDLSKVTKEQLLASSKQHISDIEKGMNFLRGMLTATAVKHDRDKITDIDGFHADFATGFANTTWFDNHRKIARHHLMADDGVPSDVNLIDVLDMVIDCVMAGMARTGDVYPLELKPEVLKAAFDNTVELMKNNITVE